MSRVRSLRTAALAAALVGLAGDSFAGRHEGAETAAGSTRRNRSPEASQARLSARQERMRRKLAKRAARPTPEQPT